MIISFGLVLMTVFNTGSANHWIYKHKPGENSDDGWANISETCGGKRQSPINIVTSAVHTEIFEKPLTFGGGFKNYPISWNIVNNGHTVSYVPTGWSDDNVPTLTGGPVGGEMYHFNSFHFHLGCTDNQGSEHTIDSRSFLMEIHCVFTNAKHDDFNDAMQQPDGLTVVGVFVEKNLNPDNMMNEALIAMDRWINHTKMEGDNHVTSGEINLSLSSLLPFDYFRYYTYNGSLTTPPCSEVVTWILMKRRILVSDGELLDFRGVGIEGEEKLCNNFRETQPLNGRIIYQPKTHAPISLSNY